MIGDPHECPKGLGLGDVADVQFHIRSNRDADPELTPGRAGNALGGDRGLQIAE